MSLSETVGVVEAAVAAQERRRWLLLQLPLSSSRDIILVASAQAAGTYKITLTDLVLTSTGGTTGPFRYVYIFNLDTAILADPLICLYDYGSSISLLTGEQLTIDFDPTNGLFQIA